jgi:penicillin-binding protein 2
MVIQYRFRLYLVALLLIGAFIGLLFRLWDVQITNQSLYAAQVSPTRTYTVRMPGVRGEIRDRNGQTLVTNAFNYGLVLNLRVIVDDFQRRFRDLPKTKRRSKTREGYTNEREVTDIVKVINESVIKPLAALGLTIDYPEKELANYYDFTRPPGLVPFSLYEGLTYEQYALLSEQSHEIPGLQLSTSPVRKYVFGSLGSHMLGYIRKADRAYDLEQLELTAKSGGPGAEEANKWLKRDHVYEPDPFGIAGLEKSMDKFLKGRAGLREHLINQKGVYVRDTKIEQPQRGLDVELTIDLRAQYIIEKVMREANDGRGVGRGAAVLIDPRNGAIRAMVSVPTYDPNKFIPFITPDEYDSYNLDESHVFINRAIEAYDPGSVFKIPVAMAGSLAGVHRMTTVCTGGVTYGNHYIKCMGHHLDIGLQRSLMKSCNSFYYRYGNKAGINNILKTGIMFGIGVDQNLPIKTRKGRIPNPLEQQINNPGSRWTEVSTAQVSIGQGGVAASPLQMANVAAIAANGGKCYQLRLIERIRDDGPVPYREIKPELKFDLVKEGISESVINTVRSGMYDVVNTEGGTARRARLDGYKVAGKTGTAQYGDGKTHAWFVCFAPYDDPQYALSVFVEDGESGGRVAAPIAKIILEELFRGPIPNYDVLEDAIGHFDVHSETTFSGDLWTVPEGESDTADTAVTVDVPEFLDTQGTSNSLQENPPSPNVREKASIVPSRKHYRDQ